MSSCELQIRNITQQSAEELREIPISLESRLKDVDGVYSAPHRKSDGAEQDVINLAAHSFEEGCHISHATGRPSSWITAEHGVLPTIRARLNKRDAERFDTSIHYAENGAVSVTRDNETLGYVPRVIDPSLMLPEELKDLARWLVEALDIYDFTTFDEDKSCVASIQVCKDGYGQEEFDPHKTSLKNALRKYTQQHTALSSWAIHDTAIAVDIHHPRVSKQLAADNFVASGDLRETDQAYVAIGDSPSDYALYLGLKEAQREGRLPKDKKIFMVFTGTKQSLEKLVFANPTILDSSDFIFASFLKDGDGTEEFCDATTLYLRASLTP